MHVARDRKVAKFWLEPVRLEYNRGFPENELNRIARCARAPDHVGEGVV